MSKLLLTNVSDLFSNLHDGFVKAGFEKYDRHIVESMLYLTAYKKLRVDSTNYYAEDKDFVAVSGTFIYKGNIGTPALQNIFHDFDGDNIQTLRRDILGSYAIILKKDADVYVFVDENHTYDIYYHNDDNKFILTNTYYHIAKHVNESFVLENMLDKICGYFFVDNQTPFTNIYKLMGNQSILYNIDTKIFEIKTLDLNSYPLKSTEFDASVDEMKERFLSITKTISSITDKITIFGTGGLDSRLVLAGFLNAEAKPDIAYWYGKDLSTATKEQDHDLSWEIAENSGLNYTDFNVEVSLIDSVTENGDIYIQKYGELATLYSCNWKLFQIFEQDLNTEFVEFGYFGEPCRSLDSLDEYYHENFCVENFVTVEYLNRFIGFVMDLDFHKNKLIKWFSDYAVEKSMDIHNLSKDDCMYLNYIYRQKADTVTCNYTNLFYYSTPVLSQRIFSEGILDVPYEHKIAARWMLHFIQSLAPSLLEQCIFSHNTLRKVNLESLKIEEDTKIQHIENLVKVVRRCSLFRTNLARRVYAKVYAKFISHDIKGYLDSKSEADIIDDIKKKIVSHPLYASLGYDVYSREYRLQSSPRLLELLLTLMQLELIELSDNKL